MNGDTALQALRYAAGELAGRDAEEFEARLATDAAAREMLGETVRLSAAVVGFAPPAPKAGSWEIIRNRLLPSSRFFAVKTYRGHPALWAGLGSLAAGLVALAIDWSAEPPPQFVASPPSARPKAMMSQPFEVETFAPPKSAPSPPSNPMTPVAGMDPVSPLPMGPPMPNPRVEATPPKGAPGEKKG